MADALTEGARILTARKETGNGYLLDLNNETEVLLPAEDQVQRLSAGKQYVVYLHRNPLSGKWYASGKLDEWLSNEGHNLSEGERVTLWTWYPSPLGWNVVINGKYLGLVYESDVFIPLEPGMEIRGFIHQIREDNRLDVRLRSSGQVQQGNDADQIFKILRDAGGQLPYGDHSDPEEIRKVFHMSKKAFKKAIGTLYSTGRILIQDTGIQIKR